MLLSIVPLLLIVNCANDLVSGSRDFDCDAYKRLHTGLKLIEGGVEL